LAPRPVPHGEAINISQHYTAAILAPGVLDAEFVSDIEPAVVGMQYNPLLRAPSNTTGNQKTGAKKTHGLGARSQLKRKKALLKFAVRVKTLKDELARKEEAEFKSFFLKFETSERQYEVEAKHDTDALTKMFDELAAAQRQFDAEQQQSNTAKSSSKSISSSAALQGPGRFNADQQQFTAASSSAKSISSSAALHGPRRFNAEQQQSNYASTSAKSISSSGALRVCRRFDAKSQQSNYASTSAKSILTRAQVLHMNQAKLRDLCSGRF
jgi:hypothetical protein